MITIDEITEYMKNKKGVTVEKVEACKGRRKTVYLVNENYAVERKAKSSYMPSSVSTNYTAKITGRKITKKEYEFYKELYNEIEIIL